MPNGDGKVLGYFRVIAEVTEEDSMYRIVAISLLFLFCAFRGAELTAQSTGDIPRQFSQETEAFDHTRQEVLIPMRDGVKLFTVILAPKDLTKPLPIILTRTPYSAQDRTRRHSSPYFASVVPLVDLALAESGYIRVFQDVRGIHKSEGDYILNLPLRGSVNPGKIDHSTDTWDTIDWLVKNVKGNNGRVGITGTSYDGWTTLMGLFNPHPALKAAAPLNPMVDVWIGDDWFHNGAFRTYTLEYIYSQTSGKDADLQIPYGYRDVYDAYLKTGSIRQLARFYHIDQLPAWKRIAENPGYTSFWREQAVDKLLQKTPVSIPVLTVHGLFDQEDNYGGIASYAAIESSDAKNDRNFLVIGPWFHGQHGREGSGIGPIRWNSETAHHFRKNILTPFFDKYLKDKNPEAPLAPVLAFETGTNQWRTYEVWPPRQTRSRRLYLQDGGALSFDNDPQKGAKQFTQYVSDPQKPVPYRVPPIRPLYADDSTWRVWLVDDQRPFASRPDVLTFVSQPLKETITISGEVAASLVASTTGSDADWVVKLIDVYPDEYPLQPELGGYQLMISADVLRGRYHDNLETGSAIQPDQALTYRVRMPHANHAFLRGHRIMVQIQSSWFPLYDRNPQTFVPNIFDAPPDSYKTATHRVYHAPGQESYVEVTVLEK